MDWSYIIMYLGFALAAYSVVGNDVIQTLGTFLSSNAKRPWYILWLFAGSIMAATLIYGWYSSNSQRVILEGEYVLVQGESLKGPDTYIHYRGLKADTTLPKDFFNLLVYPSKYEGLSDEKKQALQTNKTFSNLVLYTKSGDTYVPSQEVAARVLSTFTMEWLEGQNAQQVTLANKRIRDVSYDRLEKYDYPFDVAWWYLLPPIILLLITRLGIPVSTTFLILTFFSPKELGPMLIKSLSGYVVAFGAAIALYFAIAKLIEKRFHTTELAQSSQAFRMWTVLQWLSTGFLWWNWLSQDFANIYAYLDRDVSGTTLAISLAVLLLMLAYIFSQRGGAIQAIVTSKTNTTDIRSATIIDFTYGIILLVFKEWSNVPMSTTWVFLGLLAGREYALRYQLFDKVDKALHKMVAKDFGKAVLGLVISVALVFIIRFMQGA